MKKYKVTVYAIAKNEEKNVNKWYESMSEADNIVVLDTGSTDNTVKLLEEKGAIVSVKKIVPWRFDVARNSSLNLIPKDTDICVCTDLDEVFNKGWRMELENVWESDTTRCKYTYNWSLNEKNVPKVSFIYEKIHKLDGFKWVNPVHEILEYNGTDKYVVNENIVLNHYPDSTKSRSSYLDLLELSVKENPENDRNVHYLGREYMYYERWNECIDTLIKHLSLKSATWKDERSASMRFIARAYKNLNRIKESRMWLNEAIEETPYLRDPYVEMALLEYSENNWESVIKYCLLALGIKTREKTYINETFSWDTTIYDLLSLAYYWTSEYNKALEYIDIALEMEPYNERLLGNKEEFKNKQKEKN